MGDHADDALFAGLDQSWGWRRPRFQKMPKTCKSCGQTNLYWYEHEGQWRLHEFNLEESSFVPHSCKLKNAFKKKI